jgi:hypothetical protein
MLKFSSIIFSTKEYSEELAIGFDVIVANLIILTKNKYFIGQQCMNLLLDSIEIKIVISKMIKVICINTVISVTLIGNVVTENFFEWLWYSFLLCVLNKLSLE